MIISVNAGDYIPNLLYVCKCVLLNKYSYNYAASCFYGRLFTWNIALEKPNQDSIENDLKYRYIKMKGNDSAEQIATLEDIFEINRNTKAIEQMREDVETYEEIVRKQDALAEQARLKEQAAKEQESKVKSIKDKQQPKDNPKKSKP